MTQQFDGESSHPSSAGEPDLDRRLAEVYAVLHAMARRTLQVRAGEPLLDPTELVHECYLKLRRQASVGQLSRGELLALAATAIRTLLVDHARERSRLKRGGAMNRVSLNAEELVERGDAVDVLALDSALERLAELDARMARIVELRFFAGLSIDDTARALGVSSRQVEADWALARAWLHRELAP